MSASTDHLLHGPPEQALRPLVIPALQTDHEFEEEKCRTPTTEESRLQSVPDTCPPAPKKTRPAIRCKRRLLELELFVVGDREMERLFRRRDQTVSAPCTPQPCVKKPKLCSSA